MNDDRRQIVSGGAALAGAMLLTRKAHADTSSFDAVPPLPARPSPGNPGDFDFLTGEWRIQHRSIVNGEWLDYEGEASVHRILAGVGSVEELRIPARNFSGMGLRLLDVEQRVWSDYWVNARSGVLTTPGQTGSFENGVGIFWSDYEENGVAMKSVGIWDRISADSCRWRQATSQDGGRSWAHNWIMEWRRV